MPSAILWENCIDDDDIFVTVFKHTRPQNSIHSLNWKLEFEVCTPYVNSLMCIVPNMYFSSWIHMEHFECVLNMYWAFGMCPKYIFSLLNVYWMWMKLFKCLLNVYSAFWMCIELFECVLNVYSASVCRLNVYSAF